MPIPVAAAPLLPKLIAPVASILGGLLGRPKRPSSGDVINQTVAGVIGQAKGAREASALYGFNPVSLLAGAQPLVPQVVDNSGFGQSIANAGLIWAEQRQNEAKETAYREALEEQNRDLRTALDRSSLRPRVPNAVETGDDLIPAAPGAFEQALTGFGQNDPVKVRSIFGEEFLDPAAARRLGLDDGDWLTEQDRQDLLGEFWGEFNSATGAPLADLAGRGPFISGEPEPAPPVFQKPKLPKLSEVGPGYRGAGWLE